MAMGMGMGMEILPKSARGDLGLFAPSNLAPSFAPTMGGSGLQGQFARPGPWAWGKSDWLGKGVWGYHVVCMNMVTCVP